IYFTSPFRTASKYEKIITMIHEVLHATTTMKNIAAGKGALDAPPGSVKFAQHEADVDNAAKAIAKQLGLIPNDYPATDSHSLLGKQFLTPRGLIVGARRNADALLDTDRPSLERDDGIGGRSRATAGP